MRVAGAQFGVGRGSTAAGGDNGAVRRVSVVGSPGSGKSWVAAALARRLGVAHVELDARFHQPGWVPLPAEEFRRQVQAVAAGDGWVIDGNYSTVQDLVWARADTVVWLDPPRPLVMGRVAGRTLRRLVFRQELWNGNRERWADAISVDPQRSIIAWAWTQHPEYRARYEAAMAEPGHLRFVRLRTRRQIDEFLALRH